jgi:hypothetical protein
MKKLLLIALSLVLISCYPVNGTSKVDGWKVVKIDGCEYVYRNTHYQGYMAHKGNCVNH